MKVVFKLTVFLGIILCCVPAGCEKEMFLPGLSGNLVGYVRLLDEYSNILPDGSGVSVQTKGLNSNYSVISDNKGRYEFSGLPAGTYDLEFSKTGYGTVWIKNVQHLGGTPTIVGEVTGFNLYPTELYQFPTTIINNIFFGNDTVFGDFTFSGPTPETVRAIFYFSSEPDFSIYSADNVYSYYFLESGGSFKAYFSRYGMQFSSGETVFAKARICASPIFGCLLMVDKDTYLSCANDYEFFPSLGTEYGTFTFVFP